jgi:hypothetical protein
LAGRRLNFFALTGIRIGGKMAALLTQKVEIGQERITTQLELTKMRKVLLTSSLPFVLAIGLFAGKNLADYSLQIQVIESHWHRHRYNGIETVDGWGRANVKDGNSIRAFDFTYSSAQPFQRTIGNAHYLAKWKKESLRMEMLVGEIGASDKYQTYDLKTSVREDVYVPSPGGAIAISQEEYKAKQQPQ